MGFFDNLFKGKKIIDETVEKAIEQGVDEKKKPFVGENGKVDVNSPKEDGYSVLAEKIRHVAKQYLPGDVTSIYALRLMVKTLVDELEVPKDIIEEAEKVFEKYKSGQINHVQCCAAVANGVNTMISAAEEYKLSPRICNNTEDALLKTWVVLDCFASTLKADFSVNLKVLRNRLSDIIEKSGLDESDEKTVEVIHALEKECSELAKDKEKTSELAEKVKTLVSLLLERKALFVLFDDDFNSAFPYVGFDGIAELFIKYETAFALKKHFETSGNGHTFLRRIEKNEYEKFFKSLHHMGIKAVRVDNGIKPVDVPVHFFANVVNHNLLERFNSGMRGLFLRTSQYNARINKNISQIKDTPREKSMIECMLTARFNAYRELGNSIVYVFANPPYESGNTLYSVKALEKAKRLCELSKMDEKALIAPGDSGYGTYNGGMNFRVTRRNEEDALENSYVCVFTSRLEAEKTRLHFEKFGCNDSVVAVTFDELASQINGCAGALVDMSSYCFEIKKREFDEIKKWRAVKGKIVVNLKKKEETNIADDSETPSQNNEKED